MRPIRKTGRAAPPAYLPVTPCPPTMRQRMEVVAVKFEFTLARVQRIAVETFLNGDPNQKVRDYLAKEWEDKKNDA